MKNEIKNIILNACVVHSKDAGTYQAIMDLFASESVKMLEWIKEHCWTDDHTGDFILMENDEIYSPSALFEYYKQLTNS